MTLEFGSTSEVKIDSQFLETVFYHPDFAKRVKSGVRKLKKDNGESGFVVCVNSQHDVVVSNPVRGTTTLYGSVDDYLGGKELLLRQSVDISSASISGNHKGLVRVGFFHFHPSGNLNPSYGDAHSTVNQIYAASMSKSKISTNNRTIEGIFAVKDQNLFNGSTVVGNLSCLLYGLGKSGLTSNHYQAWDSLGQASGFKQAMIQSGFWIEEGVFQISKDGKLYCNQDFIDRVAKNLED